jgi:hypothetical protein
VHGYFSLSGSADSELKKIFAAEEGEGNTTFGAWRERSGIGVTLWWDAAYREGKVGW